MKKFLVALHVYNREQAVAEAAKILTPNGAHGILLVNNGMYVKSQDEYPSLFDISTFIKECYPGYLVGINPLDLQSWESIQQMIRLQSTESPLDILWTDDGGVTEMDTEVFLSHPVQNGLKRLAAEYYGGIAFKYLPQPKDIARVAYIAAQHFSAVITSGEKTGSPPPIEKIKLIKSLIGSKPLGIASGLTAENVKIYLPYTDICIVGTSLTTKNEFHYDQKEIENFRSEIESFK